MTQRWKEESNCVARPKWITNTIVIELKVLPTIDKKYSSFMKKIKRYQESHIYRIKSID